MFDTAGTQRLRLFLETERFQRAIMAVIVLNAVVLGMETSPSVMAAVGPVLLLIDKLCLAIFVAELLAKGVAYGTRFVRDPWNLFDLVIVLIALVPASQGLSVLRALRILRALRLVSAVPAMRRVVGALLVAIPGMGSIVALLSLVFYVYSVMATKLFGADFAEWFGTLGRSAYTLFQVMTLESWSMGIVRPVMEVFPWAWMFFVPFILMTTFTVLNLFIGIVVEAMQSQAQEKAVDREIEDLTALRAEIADLREEIRAALEKRGS